MINAVSRTSAVRRTPAVRRTFSPRGILFDLDGTLIDTLPDLTEAARRALAELKMKTVSLEEARSFVGDGVPRFVKRLLTRQWWGEPEESLLRRARKLMDSHYAAVIAERQFAADDNSDSPRAGEIYPGVLRTLAYFSGRGIALGCVTNKPMRFANPILRAANLHHFFGAVVCGDSLPEKKPHPLPIVYACERLGISPPQAMMVGDSIADARAARAAGCEWIAVAYGYHHRTGIDALEASAVAEKFEDLQKFAPNAF